MDPHAAGLPVDFFGAAADTVAPALPDARREGLEISGHVPDPAHLGPVVSAHLAAADHIR